jgi:hypothetical protein
MDLDVKVIVDVTGDVKVRFGKVTTAPIEIE